MPAKFSDIIPPNKRTIRNVPLKISMEDEPTHVKKKTLEKDTRDLMKIVEKEDRRARSKVIWGIAVFCVLFLCLVVVSMFSSASVLIVASNKPILVDMDLNLSHNATSSSVVDYDVLTMSVSDNIPESAIKAATGTVALGTKASGTVTIYNNYSKTPQVLVRNTRLESPDGKIFFLTDKVTVPGMIGNTAGSITAKIIAEKEGAAYNVGTKDFAFVGLKGTPRYKTVYAKTKTTIDGGGAAKSKVVVDPAVLNNLESSLLANAIQQINTQKSDDYIILSGAVRSSLHVDGTSTATLDVSVLLLKKVDLAMQIQSQNNLEINLSDENSKDIVIGTSSLKLILPNDTKLSKNSTLNVALEGTTTISSNFTEKVIADELAGLTYDSAEKLLKSKIGVEAVNLEVWPWWVKTVPKNPEEISVKVENN